MIGKALIWVILMTFVLSGVKVSSSPLQKRRDYAAA